MEKIVCGIELAHVFEAFLPALVVKPDSHQIRGPRFCHKRMFARRRTVN